MFAKGEGLRFIGHLDVVRLWERACRRAALPLASTHGFTPRPRLQFASPLALGATGGAEVLDAFLTAPLDPHAFATRLAPQLPDGCRLVSVRAVPLAAAAVSAALRWAEYRVLAGGPEAPSEPGAPAGSGDAGVFLPSAPDPPAPDASGGPGASDIPHASGGPGASDIPWRPPAERLPPPVPPSPAPPLAVVQARVAHLLGAASLPRTRLRDGQPAPYDLRPLVLALWAEGGGARAGEVELGMRLRADPQAQGRPDEVADALGLAARRVHRVRLGLEGDEPPESASAP